MKLFRTVGLPCLCLLFLSTLAVEAQEGQPCFFGFIQTVQPKKGSSDSVAKLIKVLGHPDEKLSSAALSALEKRGLGVIDELLPALEKEDNKTRRKIVIVLGRLRHTAIKEMKEEVYGRLETLLLKLLRDPSDGVVNSAATALTFQEPRSKKAIPELIEILRDEKKGHLARAAASVGLQNFGPEAAEAIPVLLDVLANRKYPEIGRAGTCSVLAIIGPKDERVVPALRKALKNRDNDESTRGSAAGALSRMGDPGQVALPDVLEVLKETALNTTGEGVTFRRSLLDSIGRFKVSLKEVSILIEIAKDRSEDFFTRVAAIEAIGNVAPASAKAWPAVLKLLQDEQHEGFLVLRLSIVLRKIGPAAKEAVPALEKIREAIDEPEVRDEITQTIKILRGS